jgi:hypothetical protein
MRIAILGAAGTGKTRLAHELSQLCPAAWVTDSPPLLAAIAGSLASEPGSLHEITREHQRRYDLTLLTGLDLPGDATRQGSNESIDAALRLTLGGAGIAYQVIYGSGAQRTANALKLIRRHNGPANQQRASQPSPSARWVWSCEKCGDPACEQRLFTDKLGISQR